MTETPIKVVPMGDLGDALRGAARKAWGAPQATMTVAERSLDLPLNAAMDGPRLARRILAPAIDVYRLADDGGAPLRYASDPGSGVDLVRGAVETPLGPVTVLDARPFLMVSAPAEAPMATLLTLAAPVEFAAPDPSGWASSAPGLAVQRMSEWSDRIDLRQAGATRLYLIFKVFSGAQPYNPNLRWF